MKSILLCLSVLCLASLSASAQSRVSIAPTYWFNYGTYVQQSHSSYSGLDIDISGHDVSSSAGLSVRYQFTPHWDVSIGLLHNWNSSRLNESPNIFSSRPFLSKAFQLPILANYRMTTQRLSPYFSVGGFLVKSTTFNEAPIKVNGVVGVGMTYRIDSGLSVLLEPTASYQFYKPTDEPTIQYFKYNSYSIGIQAQLNYHF